MMKANDFHPFGRFFDLKAAVNQFYTFTFARRVTADELRQNDLGSTDGPPAQLRISKRSCPLSRRLQSQKFLLQGPIPLSRLRPAHLPRKSPRHRTLSVCRRYSRARGDADVIAGVI